MASERPFHCHWAASHGHPAVTEKFCLEKCRSSQRGLKAECPQVVVDQVLRLKNPQFSTEKESKKD